VPGIFMKYDLSSLRVHIRESHQPFWQFLVRLCAIVGGIFATSGEWTSFRYRERERQRERESFDS